MKLTDHFTLEELTISGIAARRGLAADFICPGFGSPLEVAEELAANGVKFDQLINEFGEWVHLGMKAAYADWRGELLTIDRTGARVGLHRV